MTAAGYAMVFLALLLASLALCRLALGQLRRFAILDRPNPRSNHETAVPRGGGLVLVPLLLAAFAAAPALDGRAVGLPAPLLAGALLLAAISWWDDLRGLGVLPRLAVQAGAVLLGLAALADQPPVFQGWLPRPLDLAAAGILWLWFLNLFNFMDGIDGISGVEAVCIGGGLAALAALAADGAPPAWFGATLAAAAAGFLVWNWHPARIFLGDVGSVPLGFLLGFLLLAVAARGFWAPALILPAYYLADATITIARRALRRERVWQAHAEHYYQRAVRSGLSHAQVSLAILSANLVLIALALTSLTFPLPALAGAVLVVGALLAWMRP
jgi:UDP-N-acetylmuramyl pentapeptide phosphotransferase/UDP-N-acetylglucosamine-1-phosphate transferase